MRNEKASGMDKTIYHAPARFPIAIFLDKLFGGGGGRGMQDRTVCRIVIRKVIAEQQSSVIQKTQRT
jgi:hypothetical protein